MKATYTKHLKKPIVWFYYLRYKRMKEPKEIFYL